MKHAEPLPYAEPEAAARKLIELAALVEPINDRIHIEKINAPFMTKDGCNASGAEFGAGLKFAIEKGWSCTKAAPSSPCCRRAKICGLAEIATYRRAVCRSCY